MLSAIQFVQGGVARKDYVPGLTHYRIEGGRIQSFNGTLSLSAPIELDLTISPKAEPFQRAIAACGDNPVALSVTSAGRLGIKAGKFRAYVECTNEPFPVVAPAGEQVELTDEFLSCVEQLAPFISIDASRQWSQGILFRGQSMFVTNNIILVEKFLGTPFPHEVCIPRAAIQTLVKLGEKPISISVADNSATFYFGSSRWMRTQLYSTQWPDIAAILNRHDYNDLAAVPSDFFPELDKLEPFVDEAGRVHFRDGTARTSLVEDIGAAIEVDGAHGECFNHGQLSKLAGVVRHLRLGEIHGTMHYGIFTGDRLRGVIAGVRSAG